MLAPTMLPQHTSVPTGTTAARSFTTAPTEPIRVTVVVPARNEAKNLPYVLPRIPAWVDEVLLVDGNSTDDTIAVARQLLPSIRVVGQPGKGKGDALRAGFAAATGDIIVMIDADGSTDPGEIPAYVGTLLAGADFAKGSRFHQGGGTSDMELYRRAGNWGLTTLVNVLFGAGYRGLCYGYNAFWRRVLPQLQLASDGFEIETEMNLRALRAGLRVAEVPSFESERVHGVSNLKTIPDGWRVLKTIVREWRAHTFGPMRSPAPVEATAQTQVPEAPQAALQPQGHVAAHGWTVLVGGRDTAEGAERPVAA